mmetsp:Transcript_34659/g.91457  ORF Transcript_34659/g.91457 Transcript_34659/m.91457 type:complete len:476 (+) Transcript_34659:108-1535(+)
MRRLVSGLSAFLLVCLSTTLVVAEHHGDSSSLSHLRPRSKGHLRFLRSDAPNEIKARVERKLRRLRNKFLHEHSGRASGHQGRRGSHWGIVRHRRKARRASLATSGVDVEPKRYASPLDTKLTPTRPGGDVFSGAHPLIGRALDSMDRELKFLRGQREATEAEGQHLHNSTQMAYRGLRAADGIRRKLSHAKAAIRAQNALIEKLEGRRERLKRERDSALSNLHQTMEPRIAVRQRKLTTSQARLEKTELEVRRLTEFTKEHKANALRTLSEKKHAEKDLHAAEEVVKRAHMAEEEAQHAYNEALNRAGQETQALGIAETKLQASQSTVAIEQEKVSQEKVALDRTKGVFEAEGSRLDRAFRSSQVRLGRRIAHAKARRAKAERMFDQAKQSYAAWKVNQTNHSDELTKAKANYYVKRLAYEKKREEVLKVASNRAGARASSERHFNDTDWAWEGNRDAADHPMSADSDSSGRWA